MDKLSKHNFAQRAQRLLRRRWLVWGVLAFSFSIVFFHRVSLAVVADQLMAEFNLGASALGNLGAVYFYIYTVMQIPSGILADTIGPRLTVTVGTLLAAAGAALFALASGLPAAFAGRFLTGLGVSVVFVAVQKSQTTWFRTREFGTITGLTSTVGNTGAIVAATPLAYLVAAIGWRQSFLVIAALGAVAGVACWLLVRDRPQDMGLPSIAELEAYEAGVKLSTTEQPVAIPFRQSLHQVLHNRHVILLFVTAMGFNGTIQSLTAMWGIPYLMQIYGLSRTQASAYSLLAAVGTIISGPLSGLISDKLQRRKPAMLAFCALPVIAWSALVFWPGKIPLNLLKLIFLFVGLGTGGYLTVMVLAKELNPPAIAGLATGTVNTGAFLGAAILQPLVGVILDATWDGVVQNNVPVYSLSSFRWGFSICLLAVVGAYLIALRLPETGAQNVSANDIPQQHISA